jgi:hypothetical protein
MGLLGDQEDETLAVLPSEVHVDLAKIPRERAKRFCDCCARRSPIRPRSAMNELDELHELELSITKTKR